MKLPIPIVIAVSALCLLLVLGNAAQAIYITTQVQPIIDERDHFESRYNGVQKALNNRLNDEMRAQGLLPEGL
jgi:NAD dependent epimerase/dehydratase family enzyme